MGDALIGSTGFVGKNLDRQRSFTSHFTSRNIASIGAETFERVYCAAAPGSMFEANKFPERDEARIDAIIDHLRAVRCEQFVLISTIAVLSDFNGKLDETTDQFQTELAYGRNRRTLEAFCLDHFDSCLVVRLPALFGPGLKKNFLFDLLNPMPTMIPLNGIETLKPQLPSDLGDLLASIYQPDEALGMLVIDREKLENTGARARFDEAILAAGQSALRFTNPDSTFQYYGLENLAADIEIGLDAGLDVLHLAPAPTQSSDVYTALMGGDMPATGARLHKEDMRTRHGKLWGQDSGYIMAKSDVLSALKTFYESEKA